MGRPARPIPVIWAENKQGIMRRRNRWRRHATTYQELKDELCIWRTPYVYHMSVLLAVYGIATYFTPHFIVALIMFPFLYYAMIGYMIGMCKLFMVIDETAMESGRYGRIMRSDWCEFKVLDEYLVRYGYRLERLIKTMPTALLIEPYIRTYLDNTCDSRAALRNIPDIDPKSPALITVRNAAEVTAMNIHEAMQGSVEYDADPT